MYICVYIHTYIHTYKHTYIHTYIPMDRKTARHIHPWYNIGNLIYNKVTDSSSFRY